MGVEGMLRHNLLAYTIQPVPYPGRVDFASAFLSREKIVEDHIKFGKNFKQCFCDRPNCILFCVFFSDWVNVMAVFTVILKSPTTSHGAEIAYFSV